MSQNGVKVASAFVTVIPTMEGARTKIGEEMDSVLVPASSSAGTKSGKAIGEKISSGLSTMKVAIGNAIGNVISSGLSAIGNSVDAAVNRVDILNNYPKTMQALGYSATEAADSIATIKKHLDGLPSSTQDIASFVKQLSATTGDLTKATKVGLAFNDMMLASGASTTEVANAQTQWNQMLAAGKVDQQAWNSVLSAAPGQMKQLAQTMLGATANQKDLYTAIKEGRISLDQVNDAIIRLDEEGGDGFDSFASQARKASGGIGTAMENVKNRISNSLASVIDAIGQANIAGVIDGISSKFSIVGNFCATVVKTIGDAFGDPKVVEPLQKIDALLSEMFGPVADGIQAMLPSWDQLKEVLSNIAGATLDALYNVLVFIKDNGREIGAVLSVIAGGLAGFAIGSVIATVAAALEGFSIAATLAAAKTWLLNAALLANPIVLVVTLIAALIAGLAWFFTQTEEGQKIWGEFTAFLGEAFGAFVEWVTPIVHQVMETVVGAFNTVSQVVKGVIEGLTNFLTNDPIGQAIMRAVDGIKTYIEGALQFIQGVFQVVIGAIVALTTGDFTMLEEGLNNIMAGIGKMIAGAWNYITSLFSAAVMTISKVPGLIKAAFDHLPELLARIFVEVLKFGVGKFQELLDFVKGIPQKIYEFLSSIPGKVAEVVSKIHVPQLHVNGEFNLDPANFKIPSISFYATGGIATKPHFGVVGEAGPEAIIPLSKLGEYADIISGGGNGGTNVYIDGARINDDEEIEALFYQLLLMLKRRGAMNCG